MITKCLIYDTWVTKLLINIIKLLLKLFLITKANVNTLVSYNCRPELNSCMTTVRLLSLKQALFIMALKR